MENALEKGTRASLVYDAAERITKHALGLTYVHRARSWRERDRREAIWETGQMIVSSRRLLAIVRYVRHSIPKRGPGRNYQTSATLRLLAGRFYEATGRFAAQSRNDGAEHRFEGAFTRYVRAAVELTGRTDLTASLLAGRAIREAVDSVRLDIRGVQAKRDD